MEVSCHFRRDARRESFDPNTRDLLRLSVHGDGAEGEDPAVQFETRFLGRVVVDKLTDRARLEVEASAHPVSAQVDGRVLETRLMIGREVRAGDVLIVLDAEVARLAIEKRRARLGALAARRESLRNEIRVEQEALIVREIARAGGTVCPALSRAPLWGADRCRLSTRRVRRKEVRTVSIMNGHPANLRLKIA
jgi:hypothetical protein